MKKTKKFINLLLALVMMFSMTLTVFAEDATTYTITLNGKAGHTYEVYQIFTGDLSKNSAGKDVLSNIVWGDGVNEAGKTAFGAADTKAAGLTESNVKDFAKDLAEGDADIENDTYLADSKEMTAGEADADGNVVYTLSGLKPGYYLIKDADDSQEDDNGTYTAYMLKVVKDVTAEPKDSVPTVDKSVTEQDKNADDFNIGDEVTFILKATLGDEIDEYTEYKLVFHDTLSAGLTFKEYKSATLSNDEGADIDVTENFAKSVSGTTLTFSCDDVIELGANDNSVITITYTATLNSDAEIGKPGNSNKVYLEYSNNPSNEGTGKTPEDEVLVFTYELDVTKVDGQDTAVKLENAEFVLYRENDGVKEYVQINDDGVVTGWPTTEPNPGNLKSDENGLFKVIGLDAGTYYLKETKAPTGYNLLKDPVKVVISDALDKDEDQADLTTLEIKVGEKDTASGNLETGIVNATIENNAGTILPSTGGTGTTIFYLVGGILVIGAVVLLVTRKRMSNEA